MESVDRLPPIGCTTCSVKLKVMKRCTRCHKVYYCSRKCQELDWPIHGRICKKSTRTVLTNKDAEEDDIEGKEENFDLTKSSESTNVSITVKSNHKKYKIMLENVESTVCNTLLKKISDEIRVPILSMKLVGKGKVINNDNIKDILLSGKCNIFQAFGEEAEKEDDLDAGDIEAIMEELHVSRNSAIRSLRASNGDLIDAILELGNKM